MPAAAYPASLPLAMLEKTREQPAAFQVAQPRRGFGYVEPTGTDTPVFWGLTWRLTEAQAQVFWVWFTFTLQRGVLPFSMMVRTEFGLVEHELQMLPDGLMPARHLGGGIWEYRVTVMARALAGVPQPQPWNAADKNIDVTLSSGDALATLVAPLSGSVRGITARDASGDWYFEVTLSGASDGRSLVGVANAAHGLNTYPGSSANGWAYFGNTGERYNNATPVPYGATWANDTIGVRLAAGVLSFYKNGVSQGVAFTGLAGLLYPIWGSTTAETGTRSARINTGGSAFVGAPPVGALIWG